MPDCEILFSLLINKRCITARAISADYFTKVFVAKGIAICYNQFR